LRVIARSVRDSAMIRWYLKQGLKHAVALVPDAITEPHGVRGRRQLVEQVERWPADRMRTEQLRRMNLILEWAVEHVPFYQDRDLARTLPLREIDDLHQWPVLDRGTLMVHRQEFCSDRTPSWKTRRGMTTGRSGEPLAIRWEWPNALWWEQAFHDRLYRWAGLPKRFRRVMLRGGLVDGPRGPESRWWQMVPHRRALVLSVFQLSHATVERYLQAMARFRPHVLQAYPSAAAKLARLTSDAGLVPPRLTAVLTSSESLLADDRMLIEGVMNAPVFDFYGHAEHAIAAAQCERREGYHLFEDYGYAEILDASGTPVDPGVVGELVATGFHNRAMPFIRYRTGDMAALSPTRCPCGRVSRVLGVLEGRPPDYLIASDGQRVSLRFGLGSADLRGIEELRFFQSSPGVVDVRFVGTKEGSIPERLSAALRRRTGNRIVYRISRADRLPPGPGGKAVLVVHGGDTK